MIVLFLEIEIHQLNKWKSLFLRFEKKTKKMKDVIKRFPSFYDLVETAGQLTIALMWVTCL